MNELARIIRVVERSLSAYLWLHAPVIAAIGWATGGPVLAPLIGAVALAGGATLVWAMAPGSPGSRYAMAAALPGMVGIMVFQLEGHPWQIDLHMYFFVVLSMLTAYCDWRALLVGAAVTAVHHLLLNFAYPAAVFPGGASFARVVLHAVIVVLQTGVQSWIAWRLAAAFAQSEQAVAAAETARQAAESAAAERDQMAHAAEERRHAMLTGVADHFQTEVGGVVGAFFNAAAGARTDAQVMDTLVDDVARTADGAAGAAQEVTRRVETVAAATEELAASVREVNSFINDSSAVARNAVTEVERTNGTVEGLLAAADRIGDVVSLIQNIASQTNLLALNATIEAARAGDAGKGFAVVAGEVKTLAGQTAKATDDISTQVAAIQSVSSGAVAAIRDIGVLIGRIEQAVSAISNAAANQGATIDEIARSAQRAAEVTETVGAALTDVGAIVRRLDALSADRVAGAAALEDKAQGLSRQVDGFIHRIRAE